MTVRSATDLRNAGMSGAFLPGADLRRAQLQGANLGGAQLQGANLGGAHSADLTCNGLEQHQLEEVISDEDTILPPGLHVWSCWETPPETLGETLATVRESSREGLRALWLCNGRPRVKTGAAAPEPD